MPSPGSSYLTRCTALFAGHCLWLGRVGQRVILGTYRDGFVHAGNLAYMTMVAIFPFFVLGAAIFSALGDDRERFAAIAAILYALPPDVAEVIRPVAYEVVSHKTGWLLWGGGLVGLWAVTSLVETLRDILRRAYGAQAKRTFLIYRLLSSVIIVGAMILLMLSLIGQMALVAAQEIIVTSAPRLRDWLGSLAWTQATAAGGLYVSLYLLLIALTPTQFRPWRYSKWPGALVISAWWMGVTMALPPLLRSLFDYDQVYGSLAGIMISLFFFWLVGLGVVVGAELNAALALTDKGADSGDSAVVEPDTPRSPDAG